MGQTQPMQHIEMFEIEIITISTPGTATDFGGDLVLKLCSRWNTLRIIWISFWREWYMGYMLILII